MECVVIKRMKLKDVPAVVSIHLESFPGFFLSFLGSYFLRLYYSGICIASEGIAFVYWDDGGNPLGFVAGSINPRRFYERLFKRYWLHFIMASLKALWQKPRIIFKLARVLFYPSRNPIGDNMAGLYSLAVHPRSQSNGIGKQLVAAFIDEARKRNVQRIFLTTDADHNDKINFFYQKRGFLFARRYTTPEGRRMNELWMELKSE